MEINDYSHIKSTRTVRSLCKTIKKLVLESDNPSNITVQDVIDEADVSRSSFYRYFCDIYSLENYIFFKEVSEQKDKIYKKVASKKGVSLILQILQNNREYYKRLCTIESHNSFKEYYRKYFYVQHKEGIISYYGLAAYTPKVDVSLKMSVRGISANVLEWVAEDCKTLTIDELSDLVIAHFPEEIQKIIEKEQ